MPSRYRTLAALVVAACQGTSDPAPPPATGQPAGTPAPKPESLAEKMRFCPVTLPGVRTEIDDVEGGIRFVMRADRADVVRELRRRAHVLADFSAGRASQRHGAGKGGGNMRNCPIPAKDARIAAVEIEGGVEVTAAPDDPSALAAYRATARERFERAPIERATVVREESSERGETRMYSGGTADLDGDGALELVTGGYSSDAQGRRPTIAVYRQSPTGWEPLAEATWDSAASSTVRNIEIADTDGDGTPEVVALGRFGASPRQASARLTISSLERGKLAQRAVVDWHAGRYAHGYGLAIADLDADGRAEIVTGGFASDGDQEEHGFVRVWTHRRGDVIAPRGQVRLDGQGSPSMRVNDLAIGDLDGDRALEIVAAGRHGPLKAEHGDDRSQRRELGDLTVLTFAKGELRIRARRSWRKGVTTRLRTVALADLDGDRRLEIVAGGQYDGDGKPALASFRLAKRELRLGQDASSTADGLTGEVKDLIVARHAGGLRLIATGAIGDRPGRHGNVGAWHVERGQLVRDASVVSRNGDETRTRAVVVVPAQPGARIFTVGHARTPTSMVGQLLEWKLDGAP